MKRLIVTIVMLSLLSMVTLPAAAQTATVDQTDGTCGAGGPVYCDVQQAIDANETDIAIAAGTGPYNGFTVDQSDVSIGGNGNQIQTPTTLGNSGGSINNISLDDLVVDTGDTSGLSIPADATITNLSITNSTFQNATELITQNRQCSDTGTGSPFQAPAGTISNVSISGNTFSNFSRKGIYLTKVSDAVFSNNTFDGGGLAIINGDSFQPKALEINANCNATYSNIYILNSQFLNGTRTGQGRSSAGEDRTSAIQLSAQRSATLTGVTIDGVNITEFHQGFALFANKFVEAQDDGSIGNVTLRRSRLTTHSFAARDTDGDFVYEPGDGEKELWGIVNASDASVDARYNWWGTNEGPYDIDQSNVPSSTGDNTNLDDGTVDGANQSTFYYGGLISDPADFNPDGSSNDAFGNGATQYDAWLQLQLTADSPIAPNNTSTVTAQFVGSDGSTVGSANYTNGSTGVTAGTFDVTVPTFPDGVTMSLLEDTSLGTGTVNGTYTFADGTATGTFTSNGNPGTATVLGSLDNQSGDGAGTVPVDIVIQEAPPPPPPPDDPPADDGGGDTAQVVPTETSPLPVQVARLPQTGETPAWRDAFLLLLGGGLFIGTAMMTGYVYRRSDNQ